MLSESLRVPSHTRASEFQNVLEPRGETMKGRFQGKHDKITKPEKH